MNLLGLSFLLFILKWLAGKAMPMITKLGKLVTYNEELSLIKLHYLSIAWFCEVSDNTNNSIFPLALDQWPPNMVT